MSTKVDAHSSHLDSLGDRSRSLHEPEGFQPSAGSVADLRRRYLGGGIAVLLSTLALWSMAFAVIGGRSVVTLALIGFPSFGLIFLLWVNALYRRILSCTPKGIRIRVDGIDLLGIDEKVTALEYSQILDFSYAGPLYGRKLPPPSIGIKVQPTLEGHPADRVFLPEALMWQLISSWNRWVLTEAELGRGSPPVTLRPGFGQYMRCPVCRRATLVGQVKCAGCASRVMQFLPSTKPAI